MGISKFFQVIVPKQKVFFELFEKSAENLVKSAELFKKLMSTKDIYERETLFVQIKECETTGDNIIHEIFDDLNRTFITPFDRDDIHELASSLDNVVDYIDSASQKVKLYKPKTYMEEFHTVAGLILDASKEVLKIMQGLRNLKNPDECLTACIKVNEIENKADIVYHYALSRLFEKEKDAIELIKMKEIMQALERAVDSAEDISDVVKTILIKRA